MADGNGEIAGVNGKSGLLLVKLSRRLGPRIRIS